MSASSTATALLLCVAAGCGAHCSGNGLGDNGPRDGAGTDRRATEQGHREAGQGWVVLQEEGFQSTSAPALSWIDDPCPDDGPFSDCGAYFKSKGITAPKAYRASAVLGTSGWLTLELYSRSKQTAVSSLAAIVQDPADAKNRVLRLATPAHTDGVVVRSTQPLPARYRVSLRVGWADFGDGQPGTNGYDGGEQAGPWLSEDATAENGFYWLAILDAVPRPHNNLWIHHHRKVVVDSDNHYPPWMEIYNGSTFIKSGVHPVMVFAVDGRGKGDELSGKPFLSWAAGTWQASGLVRAADAYLPQTWYRVSIERSGNRFTIQVSGTFAHGGARTYVATLDAASLCVWHYNTVPLAAASTCIDTSSYPSLGSAYPHWAADRSWPDYFVLGDPHVNYYEGSVFFDDLRLEVFR